MTATAYEQGTVLRHWRQASFYAGFLAAVLSAALTGSGAAAQPNGGGNSVMSCSNPASGASWHVTIDFERQTVDGYAATIGEATISWRDPRDQGNYTLDRKSGNLTVAVPSSTGGYFLHDQCKLEK